MAILHGLAGQYGKSESHRQTRRVFVVLTLFGSACGILIGLCLNFAFGVYRAVWSIAILLVVLTVGLRLGLRRLDPWLDKLSRERIKYLRGAQIEALVAWLLKDLPDSWHIFNGIKLTEDSDIDHVVVGPHGDFCISTKSQRGLFVGTPDGLLHNNRECDFAAATLRQTMHLRDRLVALMGENVPWVQPILAVPLGWTESDPCNGKVWLVHQENLLERIAPEDARPRLTKDQIARLVRALELIRENAADLYQRPPLPTS